MKKLTKISLVVFAISAMASSAFAGALSISGSAKASYTISGGQQTAQKGIGIGNEFTLGAAGELDNGYTWSYAMDLDPAAGGVVNNDDAALTVGTPYGTVGIFVSEGGLQTDYGWGTGALGKGSDFASPMSMVYGANISDYNNIQYHTPADMLPFGIGLKVGYVPNMSATTMLSAKESDATITAQSTGRNLTQGQISLSPIDGLTIKGDAAQTSNETGTNISTEEGVSANLGAKYTMGQLSVGYSEGGHQPAVATGELTYFENKFYGIQFDVNDQLSVSYNVDESDSNARNAVAATATAGTTTIVGMEQKSIQLAYTTGGATIGIAQVEVDNADYTDSKKENQTVFSLGISF